jgi:aspartyl protease family protein
VSPGDFRPMLRTASGAAEAARVKIDRLSIGGSELHDVDAVVVVGLGTNLLGQSALRRLGKLEQDGDRMVIDPG